VWGGDEEGGIKHENMPAGSYAFYIVKMAVPFSALTSTITIIAIITIGTEYIKTDK